MNISALRHGVVTGSQLEPFVKYIPEWIHHPLAQLPLTNIQIDSRKVAPQDLFIALDSLTNSKLIYSNIQQAFDNGASYIISEAPVDMSYIQSDYLDKILILPEIRGLLGPVVKDFLQRKQNVAQARVAAVTGTNGKTTVSRLIAELLTLLGYKAAIMGTTGNGILPKVVPATHTTPDALTIQNFLHQYALQGATFISLEASSHGLDQNRLTGTPIEVGIFTNLTRDHLDYHGTLENYLTAKQRLFEFPDLHTGIFNADDVEVKRLGQSLSHLNNVWFYSLHSLATQVPPNYYVASDLSFSLKGVHFNLRLPDQSILPIFSPLLGHFNVGNLIAAMLAVKAFGFGWGEIAQVAPLLKGVPGRMQLVTSSHLLGVVDYAHTPDALEQVLKSLRPHVEGKLRVVFGCGGDRDKGKRPLMTQVATTYADEVILTADNPRTESVETILKDMQEGMDTTSLKVIADREEAIKFAAQQAQHGDIIVVAGKGHEDYQEINGQRFPFDDVQVLKQFLSQVDDGII